jgi:hypothetical protein
MPGSISTATPDPTVARKMQFDKLDRNAAKVRTDSLALRSLLSGLQ